jgi:hypothetical protein
MKASRIIAKTGVVIDFASAKRKILRKRAAAARAAQPAYDPFESPLLAAWAATKDGRTLAIFKEAVSSGYSAGTTSQGIAASIRRDLVRQAAKAAL